MVRSFVSTLLVAGFAAAAAGSAFAQAAEADRAFLERASLRAADDNCELFNEGERLALEAGYWQSRGALLRGGYSVSDVTSLAEEAGAYALQRGCNDRNLALSADRLRDAFKAFSRTPFMEYFADYSTWTASRADSDDWAVVQAAEDGARLGLFNAEAGAPPVPAVFFPIEEGYAGPVSARLFLRDPLKSPSPWLGGVLGVRDGPTPPPSGISKPYWAGDVRVVEEGRGSPAGLAFFFAGDLQASLSELDPREAVWVEFAPSPRLRNAKPTRTMFEIGDFRAAAAFAAIPKPAASQEIASADY
ncbi:MAG: hypothetical protein AAF719_14180 [Pseudomonadota bacterium]